MKTLKIVITVFAITLGTFTYPVLAQQKQGGKGGQQEFMQQLKEKLQLTDEQQKKIEGIMIAHRSNLKQKLQDKENLNKQEKSAILKEEWKKTDEQILILLDDGQKEIYKTEKEAQKNKMRENAAKRRAQKQ